MLFNLSLRSSFSGIDYREQVEFQLYLDILNDEWGILSYWICVVSLEMKSSR